MLRNLPSQILKFSKQLRHFSSFPTKNNETNQNFLAGANDVVTQEIGINEVRLMGVVVSNPVIREDIPFAAFSVLTIIKKDEAFGVVKNWHNIKSSEAKIVRSLKKHVNKGTKLYIAGTLSYKKEKDSNLKTAYVTLKKFICISSDKHNENEVNFDECYLENNL